MQEIRVLATVQVVTHETRWKMSRPGSIESEEQGELNDSLGTLLH